MSVSKSRSRRKAADKQTSSASYNPLSPLDDPFRDFQGSSVELYLNRFFYFIRKHGRRFAFVLLISFTLLLCIIGYIAWYDHRESQSLISFRKLMKEPTMDSESGSSEIAIEKLREYAKQYGHKNARLRAMLYQLQYLEKEKKFGTMAKLCLKIGDNLETPELKANFYLRGALHAENLALYKNAAKGYGLAAKAIKDKNELKAQALLGQARMLRILGKKKEARAALEEILDFAEEKNKVQKYLSYAVLYLLALEKEPIAKEE